MDLGTWEISRSDGEPGSPKCQIWQGAFDAYTDYRAVIGSLPPSGDYGIEADYPCCGVPFTTTDTTRWPSGHSTGFNNSTSIHEFAHSMRHSFDGNFAHFLFDAGRFLYPQFHEPCKQTNQGFAFNEGWAEYWAKTVPADPCGGDANDFTFEGNVAAALTGLEACKSRPQMVRVLRETPTGIVGGIHSFSEFRARFFELYGRQACFPLRLGTAVTDAAVAQSQVRSDIRSQISAQRGLIGTLAQKEQEARTDAGEIAPCRAAACEEAMETVIAPTALDAQGSQAELALGELRRGLAASRGARFRTFERSAFVRGLDRHQRAFTLANETIVIRGLRRAIAVIGRRPAIKGEGSTELFRTLKRRLAAARRAHKRRRQLPAGLRGLFAPPLPPLEVATEVPPQEQPPPPPPTTAPTTLSQTCPAVVNTNSGPPFTVSGNLSPAPAAATIRLVYTPPGGAPFARTTVADASGNWSRTIDPNADHGSGTTFGDWTVQAQFDGGVGFGPSQSSTCTVTVTD